MDVPSTRSLFERVRSLPAAGPLLSALDDEPRVYLVGGAVRDLLMGGEPYDLDVVVEGDAAALAAHLGERFRVHDRFGTSTVELDGFGYDIARARRETYARPGALPEVEPASLVEDLRRRDFTVNAIAVALTGSRAGELHAVPLALEDLSARSLRVLHDASFTDDPTRLLRLARYGSRLAFAVEPHTLRLARRAIDSGAIGTVSGARVGSELRLLAREADPLSAFEHLRELGVDRAIHPGFGLSDRSLGERALGLLPEDGRRDRLSLALAARGVPPAELPGLLARLAFEAEDRDAVIAAATRADELARTLAEARRPSQIAAAVAGSAPELVALAGALGPAPAAREWLTRLRHVRLEIDGRALLEAGVPEGPAVGRGLRAALADKLDGRLSGREAELARALAAAGREGEG
ncbi:MAG: CCA tRNA nucleotidyltransferase [Solirubrobacterales bacterium]|nr:CCA tRNA nucleotidyltransferase [Solirubrobacterales bacterium]